MLYQYSPPPQPSPFQVSFFFMGPTMHNLIKRLHITDIYSCQMSFAQTYDVLIMKKELISL